MKKNKIFTLKIMFLSIFYISTIFGMEKDIDPLRVYTSLISSGIEIQTCSKDVIFEKFFGQFKPSKAFLNENEIDVDIIVDIVRKIDLIHKNTNFILKEKIGRGFEKYVFRTNTNEALILFKKRLNYKKNFKDEVNLLNDLDHPNIVTARSPNFELFYYIQDLAKDNFFDFLKRFKFEFFDKRGINFKISNEDKLLILELLKNVAEGLNYLASQNIVHRDIKLENILIYDNDDNTFSAKISDLSFVVKIPEDEKYMQQLYLKGTPDYTDPRIWFEYLKNENKSYICSLENDIYSFGVLLYAIFHKTYPVNYFREIFNLKKDDNDLVRNKNFKEFYLESFRSGQRPPFLNSLIESEINDLILYCWNLEGDFEWIILKLDDLIAKNLNGELSNWADDEVEYSSKNCKEVLPTKFIFQID